MKINKIVITRRGSALAGIYTNEKNVEVEIIDFDNMDEASEIDYNKLVEEMAHGSMFQNI